MSEDQSKMIVGAALTLLVDWPINNKMIFGDEPLMKGPLQLVFTGCHASVVLCLHLLVGGCVVAIMSGETKGHKHKSQSSSESP